MDTLNFSICLIAKNEAATLPRLVLSLKEFQARGGQIWLLDTGSTDATVKIAKELGCQVIEVGSKFVKTINKATAQQINKKFVVGKEQPIVEAGDKLFDYSAARNHIAEFAPTDFIFTPDCDEQFTAFDIERIQQLIASGIEQLEYNFVFSHDEFGHEAIKFMHSKAYDRRKLKWTGIIHEVLTGEAKRQFVDEGVIKLEHWQNPKTDRSHYLKGLALDCFLHPDNDRNSHYFGRELLWRGRPHSAIAELKRHIAMDKWPAEKAQSMIYVGDAYGHLADPEKQTDWYNRAFYTDSTRRETLIKLARFYQFNKNYQATICFAKAALEIPWSPFYGNQMVHYSTEPHELLYWAYWWMGRRTESRSHWQQCITLDPHNPRYLQDQIFYQDFAMIDQLIANLEKGVNFTFVKRGDGEINCMDGKTGTNCDGSPYSPELAQDLTAAYKTLETQKAIIAGFQDQSKANALLHCSDNDPERLKKFYSLIKNSPRQKIFVGPKRLKQAAQLLGAWLHIVVSETNAYADVPKVMDALTLKLTTNSIIIFSAGMGAKVMIAQCLQVNPHVTCIDAGSAFDPIFIGPTRTEQMATPMLRRFYDDLLPLPKISFIIPQLDRLEGLQRCLQSIAKLNYPQDRIEVIIEEGPDTVPVKVKRGFETSTGQWIVYAANDIEFTPDSIMRALLAGQQDRGLVAFNTGQVLPDEGNICEHFMISRSLVQELGGIFDTEFHHVGVDNLLWAKAKKLNQAIRCEQAMVKHYHFSRGVEMDEVYEKGWSQVKQDRELLSQKLAQL